MTGTNLRVVHLMIGRGLLVGLTAVLAAVAFARGEPLVGAVLVGFALADVILLVVVTRFRVRAARRPPPPPPRRPN